MFWTASSFAFLCNKFSRFYSHQNYNSGSPLDASWCCDPTCRKYLTVIFKQFLTSFAKIWVTSFMDILCRSKKITILWALVCNNMDVMCSKTGWKGIFGLRLWFFDKLTVDGVGGCLTIGTQLKILALLMEIRSYWVYSYLWKNRLA